MDTIWRSIQTLFEQDDGSLPEIELVGLEPTAIPQVFGMLWREGRDATRGGATYFDRQAGQEFPITNASEAERAATLASQEKAEPIHVVLGGLERLGTTIPDLGVFVAPQAVTLDYRMGVPWGPKEVSALFELFLSIAAWQPELIVRHQYVPEPFQQAWIRYRELRPQGNP